MLESGREGKVRGTGWENWVGQRWDNGGKTDLIFKEILCTSLFLVSDFDQNTVRTLLLENGTVQKISLRLKFVFPTFGSRKWPTIGRIPRCTCSKA